MDLSKLGHREIGAVAPSNQSHSTFLLTDWLLWGNCPLVAMGNCTSFDKFPPLSYTTFY